ncbi:MAG: hypothetical protein K2I06_08625 [Ruminococcus sp.]|nr:hypothetical protein [Ruminococcus sp.]
MKFKDEYHETLFWVIMEKMTRKDVYHKSLAYLIALDDVCRNHIEEIYDFEERCINPDSLVEPWQTSTSIKTILLAFNLFTGHSDWCSEELKSRCTPSDIFCCSYAPYYWEAIKIRYPEYTDTDEWE